MKITKKQLRRIIKEEKSRLLKEQESTVQGSHDHHWPTGEWDDTINELVNQWHDMEMNAHDPGDPSMTKNGELSLTDSKDWWREQVDEAAERLESLLAQEVRKVALTAMQKITDDLINGEYS